jgi:hypothetical protein
MKIILPILLLSLFVISCDKIDEFVCDNGILEVGEECDTLDFGLSTCSSFGHESGRLNCTSSCTIDSSSCCQFRCQEGTAFCQGDMLLTCTLTSQSGCFDWIETNCTTSEGSCEEPVTGAQCFYGCQNMCDTQGETRCTDNRLERCEADNAMGCLDWTIIQDCTTTEQACHGESIKQCVNIHGACSTPGESRCNSDWIELCSTVDGSPLWIVSDDCAQSDSYCVNEGTVQCASLEPGESCLSPISISLPYTLDGSGFNNDFTNSLVLTESGGCSNISPETSEVVLHLNLTQDATLLITESGPMDAIVKILPDCKYHNLQCLMDSDNGTVDTTIFPASPGNYYIVIEPKTAANGENAYSISISTQ